MRVPTNVTLNGIMSFFCQRYSTCV